MNSHRTQGKGRGTGTGLLVRDPRIDKSETEIRRRK